MVFTAVRELSVPDSNLLRAGYLRVASDKSQRIVRYEIGILRYVTVTWPFVVVDGLFDIVVQQVDSNAFLLYYIVTITDAETEPTGTS